MGKTTSRELREETQYRAERCVKLLSEEPLDREDMMEYYNNKRSIYQSAQNNTDVRYCEKDKERFRRKAKAAGNMYRKLCGELEAEGLLF